MPLYILEALAAGNAMHYSVHHTAHAHAQAHSISKGPENYLQPANWLFISIMLMPEPRVITMLATKPSLCD